MNNNQFNGHISPAHPVTHQQSRTPQQQQQPDPHPHPHPHQHQHQQSHQLTPNLPSTALPRSQPYGRLMEDSFSQHTQAPLSSVAYSHHLPSPRYGSQSSSAPAYPQPPIPSVPHLAGPSYTPYTASPRHLTHTHLPSPFPTSHNLTSPNHPTAGIAPGHSHDHFNRYGLMAGNPPPPLQTPLQQQQQLQQVETGRGIPSQGPHGENSGEESPEDRRRRDSLQQLEATSGVNSRAGSFGSAGSVSGQMGHLAQARSVDPRMALSYNDQRNPYQAAESHREGQYGMYPNPGPSRPDPSLQFNWRDSGRNSLDQHDDGSRPNSAGVHPGQPTSSSHDPASTRGLPFPGMSTISEEGGGVDSRRSTISRTTDDEPPPTADSDSKATSEGRKRGKKGKSGKGKKNVEAQSDADMSRPSSPQQPAKKVKLTPADSTTELADDDGDNDGDEEKVDHRKRKRNRTIRSCVPCHNHKRKCDRKRPCSRCTALGITGTCVYEVDEVRDMNDPDVAESDRLRKRIAELEQVVRELRQKNPSKAAVAAANAAASNVVKAEGSDATAAIGGSATPNVDGEPDNKKRRVIVDRFARFKIDEAAMAAVASAAAANGGNAENHLVAAGKTSSAPAITVNERRESDTSTDGGYPGGTGHPADGEGGSRGNADSGEKDYRAEPYTTYLLPGEEMVYDQIGRKTFLGATAGKSMLRRLREITSDKRPPGSTTDGQDLLSVPEDAGFTGVFPDTRKTFPFTTIWSHENFSGEIIGLLPNKEQSEVLLQCWKDEVCSFFLAWHVPTLETEYRRFFAMSTAEKLNVPLSSLSLFLMICSLGCVMRATRAEIFGHPDLSSAKEAKPTMARDPKDLTSSRLQSELYLSGAYQALRLCSFLSNPSIYTIQAQILINVYLLNSERVPDAWAQTGSLIRQCIAMGLHVDPVSLDPKASMRDAEVRRRMWWTVAGFDALLCLSFGRPSAINFYQTNLPQDRTDDKLSDIPGSAYAVLPPSNVLNNETTENTYHAAYFQITIPSYELLNRIFHVDRQYSRSAIYGWFSPDPTANANHPGPPHKTFGGGGNSGGMDDDRDKIHTYEDAVRLAKDIFAWYNHIPRGMRFVVDEDNEENLCRDHSPQRVNQILALCMKTFMIVMVLHRPYVRLDPSAYPESSEICLRAAHILLMAYTVGSYARASIFWNWWTMSYRAFQAGAVCAFMAIRQPGTELAKRCLSDLRAGITVLEDRSSTWNTSHPVQGDLCNGLVNLEKLATAATRQFTSPTSQMAPPGSATSSQDPSRLSATWARTGGEGASQNHNIQIKLPLPEPTTPSKTASGYSNATSAFGNAGGASQTLGEGYGFTPGSGSSGSTSGGLGVPSPDFMLSLHPGTPLSQIRAFPEVPVLSPGPQALGMGMGIGSHPGLGEFTQRQPSPLLISQPHMTNGPFQQLPDNVYPSLGVEGMNEQMALPQFWANMFGIKMDGDQPTQAMSTG